MNRMFLKHLYRSKLQKLNDFIIFLVPAFPFFHPFQRVQGIGYGNNEFGHWICLELTCTGVGTSAILCQTLIVTVVLERQNCGTHPTLAPQAGKAHDVRAAAQLEHFALANEALVIDVDAQLQVARVEGEAFDVACDLIDLRLQAALRCLGQKKIEMESETFHGCERKKTGRERGRCESAAERAEISCKCACRSPHATCNLRFAFMLLLLSAYVCKRVGCGLRATNGADSIAT